MTVEAAPTKRTESPPRRSLGRRILRGTGWTMIVLGYVLLLFVAYELWGTNLITDGHQRELKQDLARAFGSVEASGEPRELRPVPGNALGILRIPKIDLNVAFVQGVTIEHLKKGPGHYPATALPGEEGNVGIAGHRTTYAKPFWSLDELIAGDRIHIRTTEGRYVYEVVWKRVVSPSAVEVLDPTERASLTLTTCNPRFSAAQRLIVRAVQVSALPPVGVTA